MIMDAGYAMGKSFVHYLVPLALAAGTRTSAPVFTSIDVPGATFTVALDVNDEGEIVGRYTGTDGRNHGFLRRSTGEINTIDFPGAVLTVAQGINLRGEVVGFYRSTKEGRTRGFLRRKDGAFTTIDHPAATKTSCLFLPA